MPVYLSLHERDPFALQGMGNDCRGHSFCFPRFLKSLTDLLHIVSILQINHMEIKGLKFLVNRIGRADLVDSAVNLHPVIIHNHHKIVQFAEPGKHGRFPYLPFLDLSVPEQGVDTEIPSRKLCPKSHSGCCGNPLSQRTRGHVNPRHMLQAGMSLQVGTQMAQRGKILHRKIAPVCQGGIKPRSRMPFGKHKTVPVLHLGILRVNIHFLKIEICKNIRRRQ